MELFQNGVKGKSYKLCGGLSELAMQRVLEVLCNELRRINTDNVDDSVIQDTYIFADALNRTTDLL